MSVEKSHIIHKVVQIDARITQKRLRIRLPKGVKITGLVLVPRSKQGAIPTSSIYFGAAIKPLNVDNTFVTGLSKIAQDTKSAVLTMNAVANQKFWYARPVAWGLASFQMQLAEGLSEGGFLAPKKVAITDSETGAVVDYYVYESNTQVSGTLHII